MANPSLGLRAGLAVAMVAMLPGCGSPNATMRTPRGEDLMLLGHDPVAYFPMGKPIRGDPNRTALHKGTTYYFATDEHRAMFLAAPAKYVPQYGGFCSDGAAYGLKTGSDPTEWEIFEGRLFIFGDVIGHEYWKLRPKWDVEHADAMWKEAEPVGRRWQTLKRLLFKVPWYKTNKEIVSEWTAKYPGARLDYDPGGMVKNLFFKEPGWRAREGHMQPAVGLVGVDPCPPACPGAESFGYGDPRRR